MRAYDFTCPENLPVPNPTVQNIKVMDATHISEVTAGMLHGLGFHVQHVDLYDGYYSGGVTPDGLLGVLVKDTPATEPQPLKGLL